MNIDYNTDSYKANKGHIQLCSLSSYGKYKDDYNKRLFIVRNPMKIDYEGYGIIHVPELSPWPELYKKYATRWKYGKYTSEELDELDRLGPSSSWWNLYIKDFSKQFHNEEMQINLNRIEELLNQGINILLICFCGNHVNCHRTIIGNYFKIKNYEVKFN